jgi:hypothetical protein
MTTRYYAKASDYQNKNWGLAPEVKVIEQRWSHESGWEATGAVWRTDWPYWADGVTDMVVFEEADVVLERMGWQRLAGRDWIHHGYGYLVDVKPLDPFTRYRHYATAIEAIGEFEPEIVVFREGWCEETREWEPDCIPDRFTCRERLNGDETDVFVFDACLGRMGWQVDEDDSWKPMGFGYQANVEPRTE